LSAHQIVSQCRQPISYALTASEACTLGLPVKVGMPQEVMALMKLYPQPIQQSGIEYLPINIPRQRRV
jgi:Serine dehydrogenase proteinase